VAEPNGPQSGQKEPSHPPSEPRPLATRPGADASPEGAGRFQLVVVLLLILVLVTIPLYLCRRPVAIPEDPAKAGDLDASSVTTVEIDGAPATAISNTPAVDASAVVVPAGIVLSEAHVLECHDPGSKRTAAKDCDRLPAMEHALAQAIADNGACVPTGSGGGSILYDLDVSYQRKKQPVMLTLPHEGRTLKSSKAINACAAGVKKSLANVTLSDTTHAHSRYKIEIVATYESR
jgi:hypothetical protein